MKSRWFHFLFLFVFNCIFLWYITDIKIITITILFQLPALTAGYCFGKWSGLIDLEKEIEAMKKIREYWKKRV